MVLLAFILPKLSPPHKSYVGLSKKALPLLPSQLPHHLCEYPRHLAVFAVPVTMIPSMFIPTSSTLQQNKHTKQANKTSLTYKLPICIQPIVRVLMPGIMPIMRIE